MASLTGKKLVPSKVHTTTHLPSMNIAKGLLSQSGKKSVLCSVKRLVNECWSVVRLKSTTIQYLFQSSLSLMCSFNRCLICWKRSEFQPVWISVSEVVIVMDKVMYIFALMLNFCFLQVSRSLVLSVFMCDFCQEKEAGLKICALSVYP